MPIKNNTWMPEEGEKLEGTLKSKLDNIGRYNNMLYKIQTENRIISIWGKKHLDSLMETVQIGDRISLTYTGMEQVNDFQMKKYELEILNEY